MSEKKTTNKKKKTPKRGRSNYSILIIIVMVVMLAIPTFVVGKILYDAYIRTGTPLFGDRYVGDLDPAITQQQKNTIDTNITAFQEVEDVSVNLQSSTLKVFVDVRSDVLRENYQELTQRAYDTVIETLPVETYFTASGAKKMYDVEILVYRQIDRVEDDEFILFSLIKNSTMETPDIQDISVAKDQEVADQLRYDQAIRDLGDSQQEVPPVDDEEVDESENIENNG